MESSRYRGGGGIPDTTLNNILFTYLKQSNNPCRVGDIFEHVKQYPEYDETALESLILSIIHSQGVYLCFSPEKSQDYDNKPKLFEPYRKLIDLVRHNPDVTMLSDRYYKIVNLSFLSQHIAQYLDGTRTIKALVKQLREDIENEIIFLYDKEQNQLQNKDLKDKEMKDIIIQQLEAFKAYGYFTEY